MRWFPEEAGYSAEKGYTDINLPPLWFNEDKNISFSLILDLRKWRRHVQALAINSPFPPKLPEIEPSFFNRFDHVRAPGPPTYRCLEQMRVAVACPSWNFS